MRHSPAVRSAFAFALLLSAACTRVADSGHGCELNSDCRAPLVCASTLCRTQCHEDRDCTDGATCVPYADTFVCVPPAQPVPCAFASQCGGGHACVEGTCREACTTDADCPGATCSGGSCSSPIVTAAPDAGTTGCAGTMCGARCVDTSADSEHCGDCANACALDQRCQDGTCMTCTGGTCRAANDECLSAAVVTLVGSSTVVHVPADTALLDSPLSCDTAPDAFYRFHLDQRSIVGLLQMHQTASGVGFVDSCATTAASCGFACDVSNAMAAVLDPGDHTFVAEAVPGAAGVVIIEVVPIGPDAVAEPIDYASGTPVTAVLAPGAAAPAPLCPASGPAHVWYAIDCIAFAHTLHVTTCGSAADTVLSVRSPSLVTGDVCSDESTSCPPGADVSTRLDGAIGLRAFIVSGKTPTDVGAVTLTVTSTAS